MSDASLPNESELAPDPEISALGLFSLPNDRENANITGLELSVNGVTQNTTDPIEITEESVIEMKYAWTMTAGYNTGAINKDDWAILGQIKKSLPLAQNLHDMRPIPIEYKDEEGDITIIGHVTFLDAGSAWDVKPTYAEEVQGLKNVSGHFLLRTQVDFEKITVPGQKVDFGVGSSGEYSFVFTDHVGADVTKTFLRATYGDDDVTDQKYRWDTMVWQIDVNTNEKADIPGIVTDTISSSSAPMVFLPNEVEVYPLTVHRVPGSDAITLEPGTKLTGGYTAATSAVNGKPTLTLTLNNDNNISTAYRIIVRTRLVLTEEKQHHEGWSTGVYNSASFNGTTLEPVEEYRPYPGFARKETEFVASTMPLPNGD